MIATETCIPLSVGREAFDVGFCGLEKHPLVLRLKSAVFGTHGRFFSLIEQAQANRVSDVSACGMTSRTRSLLWLQSIALRSASLNGDLCMVEAHRIHAENFSRTGWQYWTDDEARSYASSHVSEASSPSIYADGIGDDLVCTVGAVFRDWLSCKHVCDMENHIFSSQIEFAYVDCYDQEGFIVWFPRKSDLPEG